MNYNFIIKKCWKCGKNKKFLANTPRDSLNVCGDCWNWEDDSPQKDLNTSNNTK